MYGIINKTNVQNVKITMFDELLSYLAPHLCYLCGKTGMLLCDNCKYNITSEDFNNCLVCERPIGRNNTCGACHSPFSRTWYVGERADELRRLIDDYKFQRVKAASGVLAELLFERIGQLPEECVIVAIPSIPAHIRQRGYDHTQLIARHLAKLNGRQPERLLMRRTYSVQTGKTKRERAQQAASAFVANGNCQNKTILIIDDIVTTGATVKAAAHTLMEAGAAEIWVAAIARQPLD